MRSIQPTHKHEALRSKILAVIDKYADHLSSEEILAVAAFTVGQIIALQDQRELTPAQAMEIVTRNIEAGNESVLREIKSAGGIPS
jgi:hypothetical protein